MFVKNIAHAFLHLILSQNSKYISKFVELFKSRSKAIKLVNIKQPQKSIFITKYIMKT